MSILRCLNLLVIFQGLAALSVTHVGRSRKSLFSLYAATSDIPKAATASDGDEKGAPSEVRPLHQNWWPVAAISALDVTTPNAIEVLGKKLVAVQIASDKTWKVLDDRCSHRFAPLSEGRLLQKENGDTCLQCAYHGWEFNTMSGTCTRVPQQQDRVNKARPVQAYPTRTGATMLWVWTDPSTVDLAETIQLPINPLLEKVSDKFGNEACFMRDLPYGMEILGENLLDLSHLPFAHHSVGMLKRDMGGDLPTRMLSEEERIKNVAWEKEYRMGNDERRIVIPTFQAEIIDAAKNDPILVTFRNMMGDPRESDNWTCTIGYYSPCHVRYRRWRGPGLSGHVELFLCPRSEGRSRVFLFNVIEQMLPKEGEAKPSFWDRISIVKKPSTWKQKLSSVILARMFGPRRVAGHMISHSIFDGDGIFLHKQGNRMREADLTYKDYSTPSSADVLLNAYRRYLDRAAAKTRQVGLSSIADAVVGSGNYGDNVPRSEMLDRYNTHTVHCPACSIALKKTRTAKARVEALNTAMQGTAGTSTTALATLAVMSRMASITLAPVAYQIVAVVAGATWLASFATAKAEKKLDKKINSFLFEDYVHAEKD